MVCSKIQFTQEKRKKKRFHKVSLLILIRRWITSKKMMTKNLFLIKKSLSCKEMRNLSKRPLLELHLKR